MQCAVLLLPFNLKTVSEWLICFIFFWLYGDHRDLHSFPTRRSSDLESVYIEGIEQHRDVLTNFFNEAETEEDSEVQEISQQETIRVTPDGQLATVTVSTVTEVTTTDDELRLITTTDTIRFARVQDQIKVIFYTTDSQIISHDL